MPIHVRTRLFRAPKRGNAVEDYEDACWPERSVDRCVRRFRSAVADGATESSFSGLWARLLTRAYCRGQLADGNLEDGIAQLQEVWRGEVGERPLPWYAEEKLRQGAFSSLLGLTLSATEGGEPAGWCAIAAGDSCLFQVRSSALVTAFPLGRSDLFTSSPRLISSNPRNNGIVSDLVDIAEGTWLPGDIFHLMTDAVAAWFLRETEQERSPWEKIHELQTFRRRGAFDSWLEDHRRDGGIRNDDTTVLSVELL